MNERTHRITFDPAALTEQQRDGLACVVCGQPFTRAVPVGMVDGGQVFACTGCADRQAPAAATVPGTWPDGEPDTVRAAAQLRQTAADLRAHADRRDEYTARMRRLADECDRHADAMDA